MYVWFAENNLLKSTIKLECNIYGCWLINNDVCCLGQFRSVGASDLIPCKTLWTISVNHLIPFLVWCFLCCEKAKTLLQTDTLSHTWTDTGKDSLDDYLLQAGKDSDLHNRGLKTRGAGNRVQVWTRSWLSFLFLLDALPVYSGWLGVNHSLVLIQAKKQKWKSTKLKLKDARKPV